ncbi:unnamed protein product [Lactuca virosa]|uniref:Amino acid permease/ SLC12A domain-containing protein n=1 Tax=Lactuca virosa TaxID=75947 RepID=A0AAU9PEA3_9ASTR|nr:unnamed protein product [Lactuca virosa]
MDDDKQRAQVTKTQEIWCMNRLGVPSIGGRPKTGNGNRSEAAVASVGVASPRLVNLVEFTNTPHQNRLLVVEFMSNRTLYDTLHISQQPPNWGRRTLPPLSLASRWWTKTRFDDWSWVYILVGTVAREHSGPALAFSFLIASIATAVSAFCYAELASRCPSARSAYHYSYICVGEDLAWIMGWALILEYTIGGSASNSVPNQQPKRTQI